MSTVPRSRIRRHAVRARASIVLLAVLLGTLLTAPPASAYWTSTGSGSGSAPTDSLAPPTDVTAPADNIRDVPVSWTAGVGGPEPEGYYVTRRTEASTALACGTPAVPITGLSCTDTGVPDGEHTYVVTAVFRSWTATSAPSAPAVVVNPTQLLFDTEPTDVGSSAIIAPPVSVSLRALDGTRVELAGVTVTVAIGSNPSSGILSGSQTAQTDASGTATFADLSIDRPGTSYTLVAEGPELGSAAATSAQFDVLEPPLLGRAGRYSVLAGTGVVNTLGTDVSGDLGLSDSGVITGFPPGTVGGDLHVLDADARAAQADRGAAFLELKALTATAEIPTLGGLTLTPGTYHSTGAMSITGTLTLDGLGDPNAVFVFQTDAAFNTAAASSVTLVNGASAANVYWVVSGAAGTGANSTISGTILAEGAITLGDSTLLIGQALSKGTVTMASNTIRFTTALPPSLAITGGSAAVTKDTTPAISGTSNAANGSPVTVRIAGQTLTTTVQGGTWSLTVGPLLAGAYPVEAKVRDASGNGSTAAQALTVEVNPPTVPLASTGSFSVLAGTGVVSTGSTQVSGDLGVSPSNSITGFPPGTVGGDIHTADTTAATAQTDLTAAYADAAGRAPHTQIGTDLGGRTYHAGVHHAADAMALTGNVTLDAENITDSVFIFQTDAAFNTAAGSTVTLVNGATAANVFWVVAGAAGTGATSTLSGTILATGAITLGAGTELIGRALSKDTITLADNTIRFTTASPSTMVITGGATSVTKDTTPAITGTSNAPDGSPVTIRLGGQTLSTTVQGGTWSVTAATLTAGSYDVAAKVRDASGNGTNATQTLTVEVNPTTVDLGSAASFSVLAGGDLVSTGTSTLSGDLGVSPLGTVTGFPPGVVGGTTHLGDATAADAQSDLLAAYTEAKARTAHTQVTGDLSGQTFHAGVHHATAAMALTASVTLDAQDIPGSVFIFQTDGAFNTAAASSVNLVNGATAAGVFWVSDGAVGTGATSALPGTILTPSAITLGAGARLDGRALSRSTVTLASNVITTPAEMASARRQAEDPEARSAPEPSLSGPAEPTAPATAASPTPTATPDAPGTSTRSPAPTDSAALTDPATPTDTATPTDQTTPTPAPPPSSAPTPTATLTTTPSTTPTPTATPSAASTEVVSPSPTRAATPLEDGSAPDEL